VAPIAAYLAATTGFARGVVGVFCWGEGCCCSGLQWTRVLNCGGGWLLDVSRHDCGSRDMTGPGSRFDGYSNLIPPDLEMRGWGY